MRSILSKLFQSTQPAQAAAPPAPVSMDEGVTALLDPGSPYSHGEPVPRWPEQGAALVAASPEALLQTQASVIDRIKGFSPMRPEQFDQMLTPVFLRYAQWVHLLPASEAHHHFGPGGLLTHGFEVALHAARMADGKQVGVDLTPRERTMYQPRWKVATMLGGLMHDMGKPLMDCGATDTSRTLTWKQHAGSLYEWLQDNGLTHYQIYWRPGARHERHKPVGTAMIREILGKEMLTWLSDEPTQEVMGLLMASIAQGRTAGNLMSVVISQADSLSVEADLKLLARKTQATGQGGRNSVAAMVMAELRGRMEANKIEVNKAGGPLWVTTEGCYGIVPKIFEGIIGELTRKQVHGVPASASDLVQMMADNGFIEPAVGDADSGEYSNNWHLKVEIEHKDSLSVTPALMAVKFKSTEFIFGNLPLPTLANATASPPFMTEEKRRQIAESVNIREEPQSAQSALAEGAAPASSPDAPVANAPDGKTGAGAAAPAAAPAGNPEPVAESASTPAEPPTAEPIEIENRRNRRDHAEVRSVETQRRRERHEAANTSSYRELVTRLERTSVAGPAIVEIFRRIGRGKIAWGVHAIETADGLVVATSVLDGLGMELGDILQFAAKEKWLVTDPGATRKVTEREFPKGGVQKCVIFTGLVLVAWKAVCAEVPHMLDGKPKDLPGDEDDAAAPAPVQSSAPAERQPAPAQGGERPQRSSPPDAGRKAPVQPGNGQQEQQGQPRHPNGEARPQPGKPSQHPKPQSQPRQQTSQGGQQRQTTGKPERQTPPAPAARSGQGQGSAPAQHPAPNKPAHVASPGPSSPTDGGDRKPGGAERPMRPALGAAPAPGREATAGTDIMQADAPSKAAAIAPSSPPTPAPTPSSTLKGADVQARLRNGPQNAGDIACRLEADVATDEVKRQWINGKLRKWIYYKVKSQQLREAEIESGWLLLETQAFGKRWDVHEPVIIAALQRSDNPPLIFKKPKPTRRVLDLKDMKLNADYIPPPWLVEEMKQIDESLAKEGNTQ